VQATDNIHYSLGLGLSTPNITSALLAAKDCHPARRAFGRSIGLLNCVTVTDVAQGKSQTARQVAQEEEWGGEAGNVPLLRKRCLADRGQTPKTIRKMANAGIHA
jgi:hypothetical protein